MKIRVLTIGKPKKDYINAAVLEYEKFISRYIPFEIVAIREEKIRGKEKSQILAKEKERVQKKLTDDDLIVVLDVSGKQFSSEDFSKFIQHSFQLPKRTLTFIIGGPLGLSETLKRRSNLRLSISKMTIAHELSLVVLIEQIYRALSILHGSKYHK